jgi:uncharacterized protein (DUF2236 family)
MTKTTEEELADLKNLVSKFMDAIYNVPFRAVDCDQDAVEDLWNQLCDALPKDDVKKRYQ